MADSASTTRRPLILAAIAGVVLVVGFALYFRDSSSPEPTTSTHVVERPAESQRHGDRSDRLQKLREAHEKQQQRGGPAQGSSAGAEGGKMNVPAAAGSASGDARIRPRAGMNNPGAAAPAPAAQQAQGQIDEDPEDIPSLKRMALDDADAERRLAAVTLLGASDDPQAIPILAQALQDQDEEVRLAAIQSLADVTGDVPVDVLGNAALNDPSSDNRYEALEVLADLGGPAVKPFIEKAAHDGDEEVSDFAKSLLENDDLDEESGGAQPTPH